MDRAYPSSRRPPAPSAAPPSPAAAWRGEQGRSHPVRVRARPSASARKRLGSPREGPELKEVHKRRSDGILSKEVASWGADHTLPHWAFASEWLVLPNHVETGSVPAGQSPSWDRKSPGRQILFRGGGALASLFS